ncbi:hypothetical protein L1049_021811 [Liquidambar formosana]|uniref:Uncharacterized protein n=1 Tax=Liquidambar formosana TaxID=63359 RepID=A0AAP0RCM7_LIQFO
MASKFLRIEQKSFDIQLLDDGDDFLKISENGRGMRISIYLDKESCHWIANNLLELACGNGHRGWIRKLRNSKNTLLLEYHQNSYGYYGRSAGLYTKGGSRFIVIPSGADGRGWQHFADCIKSFLKNDFDKKGSSNNISQACLHKVPIINPSSSNAFQVSSSFNAGKENPSSSKIVLRLIGDWKKFFVCEREKLGDNWRMIQAELCKLLEFEVLLMPFQINKAVFFCHDIDRAMYFLGRVLLKSGMAVILSEWGLIVNSTRSQRFCFNGGWISIEGLPFHL